MILTGEQKAALKEAVVQAYREEELEVLLTEKMELSYEAIARGATYTDRVAFLIKHLENEGKIGQFIQVIVEKKSNSPYLERVKKLREIEKIPSNQGDYSSTPVDRNQLLNLLKGLITAQFNELVYVLNIPDEYLPGQNTPQAERAIALLEWASAPGGIGLNRIQGALNAIINPR
jgi:hypothetical protein